jgi:hypothetical protein
VPGLPELDKLNKINGLDGFSYLDIFLKYKLTYICVRIFIFFGGVGRVRQAVC